MENMVYRIYLMNASLQCKNFEKDYDFIRRKVERPLNDYNYIQVGSGDLMFALKINSRLGKISRLNRAGRVGGSWSKSYFLFKIKDNDFVRKVSNRDELKNYLEYEIKYLTKELSE